MDGTNGGSDGAAENAQQETVRERERLLVAVSYRAACLQFLCRQVSQLTGVHVTADFEQTGRRIVCTDQQFGIAPFLIPKGDHSRLSVLCSPSLRLFPPLKLEKR